MEIQMIIVTKHAQQRIRERCGLNKSAVQRFAEIAYEQGLKHGELKGNLKKWVDKEYFYNKTADNIRLYGDKCYIFRKNKLITIIQVPHNLIKDLNAQMSERKNKTNMPDLQM